MFKFSKSKDVLHLRKFCKTQVFVVSRRKSECLASQSCAHLVRDNLGSPAILNQTRNSEWHVWQDFPVPWMASQSVVLHSTFYWSGLFANWTHCPEAGVTDLASHRSFRGGSPQIQVMATQNCHTVETWPTPPYMTFINGKMHPWFLWQSTQLQNHDFSFETKQIPPLSRTPVQLIILNYIKKHSIINRLEATRTGTELLQHFQRTPDAEFLAFPFTK